MSRQPRFEIVRTAAGWHARFRAANGQVVWVTELYKRRRAAERALLVLSAAFWDDSFDQARFADLDEPFVTNGDGDYVEVREVDER